MTDWSSGWLPAARDALVGLRGSNVSDANGLSVPMLSVVDSTAVLAKLTGGVLGQLNRLRDGSNGPAALSTMVDTEGVLTSGAVDLGAVASALMDGYVSADRSFLSAPEYLAAYPPPPTMESGKAWFRSRHDYRVATVTDPDGSIAADTWAKALAGQLVSEDVGIYTVYTPNGYDDTSGQLSEHRELIAAYQRACDAIAAGALSQPDMTQAMPGDAMLAFWSGVVQVAASLDTLQDVPPRPPTEEVLRDALTNAAQFVGDAVATASNVAGKVVKDVTEGFFSGLGIYGVAAIVATLAIYFALH